MGVENFNSHESLDKTKRLGRGALVVGTAVLALFAGKYSDRAQASGNRVNNIERAESQSAAKSLKFLDSKLKLAILELRKIKSSNPDEVSIQKVKSETGETYMAYQARYTFDSPSGKQFQIFEAKTEPGKYIPFETVYRVISEDGIAETIETHVQRVTGGAKIITSLFGDQTSELNVGVGFPLNNQQKDDLQKTVEGMAANVIGTVEAIKNN